VIIDRTVIKKILVIKLRAVGDVLLSTIVTKNLRLAFPDACIDYLTESPGVPVLKGNPYVDATLEYDRASMSGLALVKLVRGQRYDMVIDLFGNPRTALVSKLSGARYRVGYRFRGRTYAYNVMAEPRGAEVHNTEFNLDALRAIGVAIQDRNIYFQFTSEDAAIVDAFLPRTVLQGKLLIGVNTGGGWYTKRWGVDRFAALSDRLIDRYGAMVVLTWGPGQLAEAERLQSMMRHNALIPPATTLPQLGALLKRCSIVVTNDSGPMHIAAAVGTPVLGIYGPTSPVLQGPFGSQHLTVNKVGLDCLGCNLTECPIGHPCMLELSVDAIMRSVEELLAKNKLAP
jgi:lipopolysaccharide heptosyltransferase II